jgi:hypothetical protein
MITHIPPTAQLSLILLSSTLRNFDVNSVIKIKLKTPSILNPEARWRYDSLIPGNALQKQNLLTCALVTAVAIEMFSL